MHLRSSIYIRIAVFLLMATAFQAKSASFDEPIISGPKSLTENYAEFGNYYTLNIDSSKSDNLLLSVICNGKYIISTSISRNNTNDNYIYGTPVGANIILTGKDCSDIFELRLYTFDLIKAQPVSAVWIVSFGGGQAQVHQTKR